MDFFALFDDLKQRQWFDYILHDYLLIYFEWNFYLFFLFSIQSSYLCYFIYYIFVSYKISS